MAIQYLPLKPWAQYISGSTSDLSTKNPILGVGQLALDTDTQQIKMGTGQTWSNTLVGAAGGGLSKPAVPSGGRYVPFYNGATTTTTSLANNSIYSYPIIIDRNYSFSGLEVAISTGVLNGLFDVAIYRSDSSGWTTGNPIYSWLNNSGENAGPVSLSGAFTATAGEILWFAIKRNAFSHAFRAFTNNSHYPLTGTDSLTASNITLGLASTQGTAFPTYTPAVYTSQTYITTPSAAVFLTVA